MSLVEYSVLATKVKACFTEGHGIVDILFVRESDSKIWVRPDPSVFQKGRIWVHNNYELIDQFEYGKIFQLTSISKTNFTEDLSRTEDYCDWTASGKHAKTISDSEFIPVYDIGLPPIDTGILNFDSVIPYTRIFIKDHEFVYGPFTVVGANKEYKVDPYTLPIAIEADHVTKVPFADLLSSPIYHNTDICADGIIGFTESFTAYKSLFRPMWEVIDFISDVKLISYLANAKSRDDRRKNLGNKGQISGILAAMSEVKVMDRNELAKNRFQRGLSILKETYARLDYQSDLCDQLFDEFKKTAQFKKLMESNQKAAVLSEEELEKAVSARIHEERKNLNGQLSSIQARVTQLEGEESRLEERLNELNLAAEEAAKATEASRKAELMPAIAKLVTEKDSLEVEIADLRAKAKEFSEKYDYIKDYEGLLFEIKRLTSERNKGEAAVNAIRNLLTNDKELGAAMGQHFALANLLQNKSFAHSQQELRSYTPPMFASNKPRLASDLVSAINTKLSETSGRAISDYELANVLICMQQSLITLFHGRPGTGKTSTARRLAFALGLTEHMSEPTDNYIYVPVGKGWVKQSDFIGFYNSLTGEYQPARTGMYDFVRMSDEATGSFRIALIDEMNLSVPEHYMSDIIGMCDIEGRFAPLALGGGKQPHNVNINRLGHTATRFVGTLNHDSTTEPLSARLIDRCPIISFDLEIEYPDFSSKFVLDGAITHDLMNDYFGYESLLASGVKAVTPRDLPQLVSFLDECSTRKPELGNPIEISGRKSRVLSDYLTVATHIFNDEVPAQDFAVSQFIVPGIKGDGVKFKARLEGLRSLATKFDWQRTATLLDRLIESGESNLNSYSFV